MFSFAEGNTFLAVFAGTMSGILGGYSMQFLPWTAIQEAYVSSLDCIAQGEIWMRAD